MEKKKVIIISMLIAFAIFVSLYFDSEIIKGISLIRNNFLNEFFMGLTFISSGVIIFFFLTGLFLWKENKENCRFSRQFGRNQITGRKWILPLWFTFGLSVVVSFLLKVAVQRPRPFQLGIVPILAVLEKSSYLIWNFSFPSFHTMLSFCAIPILSKEFPKFKYVWIIFAGLIAFSRIYFGLHFLSDVIIGGLIGYLLGAIIVKTEKENKFWDKIYGKVFKR